MIKSYNKYRVKRKYKNTFGVLYPTDEYQVVLVEENSSDCGYVEPIYRWEETVGYICDYQEFVKYAVEEKKVSYDSGDTWATYYPIEQRRGRVIVTDSNDCSSVVLNFINHDFDDGISPLAVRIYFEGISRYMDFSLEPVVDIDSGETQTYYCIFNSAEYGNPKIRSMWLLPQGGNIFKIGTPSNPSDREHPYIEYDSDYFMSRTEHIVDIYDEIPPQYRWHTLQGEYICSGTTKYEKEAYQVSYDRGSTWQDVVPAEYRAGDLIEAQSEDCGYIPPQYRWHTLQGEYVCSGTTKYEKQVYQVSYDRGSTWQDVVPAEYRAGDLIEIESRDCGFIPIIDRKYLTFVALEDGRFSFKKNGTGNNIEYSLDNGVTWTSISSETNTPTVTAGSKILWKATLTTRSAGIGNFSSTGRFNVEGNPMSLLYGDNFIGQISLSGKYDAFFMLFFNCVKLVSAENLSLPATTLTDYCYGGMFYRCSSLTTAPELPATTLAGNCYDEMFYACTSLTTAPELPATELASNCYEGMFRGCTSLTTAPQLPATTLKQSCYYRMFYGCTGLTTAPQLPATTLTKKCYSSMFYGCTGLTTAPQLPATTLASSGCTEMFYGCTSLTTAPELPATTLADYCYYGMFYGCTSLTIAPSILPATTLANYCYQRMFYGCSGLTTAPELPAQTLAEQCYYTMFYNCRSLTTAPELPATTLEFMCYYHMFDGCRSLNYIKCLATDITAYLCTNNWVNYVASSGTFVKASGMNDWTTGASGIPSGWTVVDNV